MNRPWEDGIEPELTYWKTWILSEGGRWSDDYMFRTDPNALLQDKISGYLDGFCGERLNILDVGAGPMTIIGKKWKRASVDITAVDALAEHYEKLPYPEGLPLVKTIKCDSERLSDLFSADTFDVAYARNTLDHGYDPLTAIKQMIFVTKPNGIIILDHFADEATKENWQGFHQWNFSVENSDVVIKGRTEIFHVLSELNYIVELVHISPDGAPVVFCVMQKSC